MDNILDIFSGDAFSVTALTAAINKVPYTPTRIGDLNLFAEQGVSTTSVAIEYADGKINLVPAVPRGAPAQPNKPNKSRLIPFLVPHLPQRGTIMADEVQNVRVFGSSDQSAGPQAKVNQVQALHKANLDYTIEAHRLGAISGQVLNADGSVMFDLYQLFGLTQTVMPLSLTNDATKSLQKVIAIKRAVETNLGASTYDHIHVLCSPGFMDTLTGNAGFLEAFKRWQDGQQLRTDYRNGVQWAGVVWEEYRGAVGGQNIADGDALAFPVGVPDMFITRFAPADYVETVNTIGLPYYTKQEPLRFGKGIELESQSNPLNLNTRPEAVVRLKAGTGS